MSYCLYIDKIWVGIWSESPSINELNQVIKDRDISVKLFQRKIVKESGVEYKLVQHDLKYKQEL
jgi:hypothetical protein